MCKNPECKKHITKSTALLKMVSSKQKDLHLDGLPASRGEGGLFVSGTSLPRREIEETLEWISIPLAIPVCKNHSMWPCRDTTRRISHLGDCPPPGGISPRLRGLPRCIRVPSFGINAELGNNPPLCKRRSASCLRPHEYQPHCFVCVCVLL